ncbi:MAG: RlmE family RNA methyltransferase, partial [Spirochaetales bacterium]|nr:RlmE family RNA methyltransferase [Spirochaetales bacterium]
MSGQKKPPRPGGNPKARPANPRSAPDHYALKAKKEGYPARSVYKLAEIEERFKVMPLKGLPRRVLDIGAAPGSWSLYLLRRLKAGPPGGLVAAVDLKPLASGELAGAASGFAFFAGNVFAGEIQEKLAALAPFGALFSDAAPDTTGNRTVDTARSLDLARGVWELCPALLAPGGNLV